MNAIIACNLILDSCGILILLLLLIPAYVKKNIGEKNNLRGRFLIYAMAVHYYVLFINLIGNLCIFFADAKQVEIVCDAMSRIFIYFSVAIIAVSIFCDENSNLTIPHGCDIPVRQIACMVIPMIFAFCISLFLPKLHLYSVAWSVSLNLIYYMNLIDTQERLEEEERKLELSRAAQMAIQMQPHFVFNTLSSIKTLCRTDPEAAEESIDNLAGYLRGNIDALSCEGLIPFDEEMRHIHQYVALEHADQSQSFSFDYELNVRDFSVPPLCVQTLVENAVKHGALVHRDGTGKVFMSTDMLGDYIQIVITDNGPEHVDLTDAQKQKKGIGISNTKKRLQALCDGSLSISSDSQGTKVVIMIPQKGRK